MAKGLAPLLYCTGSGLRCGEAVEERGDVIHKARGSEFHAWVGRDAQVLGLEVAVEAVDEDGVEDAREDVSLANATLSGDGLAGLAIHPQGGGACAVPVGEEVDEVGGEAHALEGDSEDSRVHVVVGFLEVNEQGIDVPAARPFGFDGL